MFLLFDRNLVPEMFTGVENYGDILVHAVLPDHKQHGAHEAIPANHTGDSSVGSCC